MPSPALPPGALPPLAGSPEVPAGVSPPDPLLAAPPALSPALAVAGLVPFPAQCVSDATVANPTQVVTKNA